METLFKIALSNLLDKTGIYSRFEWASYLLVSEPAISQWTNGRTLPKAEHLSSILLFLENYDRKDVQQYVYEFYQMADLPIEKTLEESLQDRYGKYQTITEYISLTYQDALNIEVSDLNGLFRKHFYYLCSYFARALKDVKSDFNEVEASFVLSKALSAITERNFQQLITSKLVEQSSPAPRSTALAPNNIVCSVDNWVVSGSVFSTCQMRAINHYGGRDRTVVFTSLNNPSINYLTCKSFPNSNAPYWIVDRINLPQNRIVEQLFLERISVGDKDAFKIIFDRYAKDIVRHLSRSSLPQSKLEELVQNVFVAVWRNRNELVHLIDFKSYLYRMADMCFSLYEVDKIRSTSDEIGELYASFDKEIKEGFEVVKEYELSNP
ncbi:MAG TPA: sigma factor [Puia sp.]|uniref:RNA polymerase sigma factor n=1 Tax=Puia sp. TaxID=2045100 RepID=UPI002CB74E6E|nr:sigma factor [Puia sp.]HVU98722.1 sigma factor [Puia sp.]